jgi:SpoVK/Ycf46/Vps4 family AAA+-type ATPase
MEYFEGIMFMTTNRMDSIDTAFASRVHLMLAYPRLGEEARRVVWATFISSTSSSTAPEWLDDEFLDEVAAYEINGRQIKNVTRVACAIAAHEERELAADDIIKGLTASSYMSSQRPEKRLQQPPQPTSLRTQYLGCYNHWFQSFGRELLMVLPTIHVVGPLLAIGVSSVLRHGIKLGISVYQRFRR